MENNKTKIQISNNFGQDSKQAKSHADSISKLLKPLQDEGLLEFQVKVYRKCDFCGKELKADKFITIGNDDKCEECQMGDN